MSRVRTLLAAVAAIAMGAGLPGCVTTSGTTLNVQDVQAAAVAACAFLPTATTVASLIAANNPALNTAEAIAAAICAAVTAKSAPLGASGPAVAGVPIRGQFTLQ